MNRKAFGSMLTLFFILAVAGSCLVSTFGPFANDFVCCFTNVQVLRNGIFVNWDFGADWPVDDNPTFQELAWPNPLVRHRNY